MNAEESIGMPPDDAPPSHAAPDDEDLAATAFVAAMREKLEEVERLVQKEAARYRQREAPSDRLSFHSGRSAACLPSLHHGTSGTSGISMQLIESEIHPAFISAGSMNSLGRANTKFDQVADTLSRSSSQQHAMPKVQDSTWGRLKVDKRFRLVFLDSFVGIFIILNAIAVGLSCDVLVGWYGWVILDGIFATIFMAELALKVGILGCRGYFSGQDSRWNTFEAALVALALVEIIAALFEPASSGRNTKNLSLFRILRLTRITRLLRVCRFELFSELMVMIKGTIRGFKTLLWASFLLALPLYGVSILFRETLGVFHDQGNGAELFSSVPESFYTILRCITGNECTDHSGRPIFALVSSNYGWGYAVVYCTVELLMTFGLFNVISAIFIENVLAGAKANHQMLKRQRLRDNMFFAKKMAELVAIIMEVSNNDEIRQNVRPSVIEGRGTKAPDKLLEAAAGLEITPELFDKVRQHADVTEIFQDLALAEEDIFNLFETLDADGSGTVDIQELFEGIAKLRGEARRSDVIANNMLLHKVHHDIRELRQEAAALWERQTEQTPAAPRSPASPRSLACTAPGSPRRLDRSADHFGI